MNIAFLIPCKGNDWKNIEDCMLYKKTLSSLQHETKYNYIFYIGYDNDDIFYSNKNNQRLIEINFPNYMFHFIEFPSEVQKGHLTKMWNILYKEALNNKNNFIEYFYQCGDDIIFETNNWINDCVLTLHKNKNIGIVGPKNDHPQLLTQVMVSRRHYTIFNCLFPEDIFNWGCDDWINIVYMPKHRYILNNHVSKNKGGVPRYETSHYDIISLKKTIGEKAMHDQKILKNYLVKKLHIS